MQTDESLIGVLNDLVKINNDRIAGYETALEETSDSDVDLRGIFRQLASNSHNYVRELSYQIEKAGGTVSGDTTISGSIYRTWMDVKAAFMGGNRKSILESCEYGEDAAQKAYESALISDTEIDAVTRQLILSQKAELKEAHNIIKRYRDLQTVIS